MWPRLPMEDKTSVVSSAAQLFFCGQPFPLLLSRMRPTRVKMTVGMSQRNFMPVTVDAREDRVAAAAASLYVKSFAAGRPGPSG